ncbi:hypothetical protein APUTEX25_002821 [Auxenochlorella protothecoides]|uniref:GYF domain-containing protein n=1 Tax=Auxenochlorella protothecoides TaxID=3075 RepID=A0A3M7L587_AUXPR|nr:hypothetical protein APUTEX25_002821 [Auxenochlorella protothecoides]|eukprot:RMZ56732.1 hypothetical protein APUTEX25_002821 [Auxenochlorella protothecoides]
MLLQLRDSFLADHLGRKVLVHAQTRAVAASAIQVILFQLSHTANAETSLEASQWQYLDNKGRKHGPYPLSKMVIWAGKKAFPSETMPVQHSGLRCWIPLWTLSMVAGQAAEAGASEEEAMDWESMAAELKKERSAGVLSAAPAAGRLLPDFPELAAAAAGPEPMELEEALPVTPAAGGGATARALIVVDTNVLISHPATLERLLHALAAAADPPSAARESRSLEVQALVPWIVLNELDRLKSSPDGGKAAAAAHALQRLRLLLMTRDAGIRGQTAAEHAAAMAAAGEAGAGAKDSISNDTAIIQSCLYYASQLSLVRLMGHWRRYGLNSCQENARVLLLSNDVGLGVRAGVSGVLCFTATRFPRSRHALLQVLDGHGPPAPAAEALEQEREKLARLQRQGERERGMQFDAAPPPQRQGAPSLASHESTLSSRALESAHARALREQQELSLRLTMQAVQQQRLQPGPRHHSMGPAPPAAGPGTAPFFLGGAPAPTQHGPPAPISLGWEALRGSAGFSWADDDESPSGAAASAAQHGLGGHASLLSQQAQALAHAEGLRRAGQPPPAAAVEAQKQAQLRQLNMLLQAMHAESLADMVCEMEAAVVENLQPAVQHYRQLDVGDLWLETLKEEDRPPWDASSTLRILSSHRSTYWHIIPRALEAEVKSLERFFGARAGGRALSLHALASNASSLLDLLMAFSTAKPSSDPPTSDPSDIPDYISIDQASSALHAGVQRIKGLLDTLPPA